MGERRRAQEKAAGDQATTHVHGVNQSHGNALETRLRPTAAAAAAAATAATGEGGEGGGEEAVIAAAPLPPSSSPPHRAAAHGVIVASRVSSEKYAALRALMNEEGGREGGKEGGMDAYGTLEYMPVPRLLVLKPRGKEGGREEGREEGRAAPSLGM